jgi:hypothetical protein
VRGNRKSFGCGRFATFAQDDKSKLVAQDDYAPLGIRAFPGLKRETWGTHFRGSHGFAKSNRRSFDFGRFVTFAQDDKPGVQFATLRLLVDGAMSLKWLHKCHPGSEEMH